MSRAKANVGKLRDDRPKMWMWDDLDEKARLRR